MLLRIINISNQGDSGGALSFNGQQIGITSFVYGAGCAIGYPSAFERVSEHSVLINAYINYVPL
jgi:hypothetical protein